MGACGSATFWDRPGQPRQWERPGLRLELWPGWLHATEQHATALQATALSARALEEHLRDTLPWSQPEVTVYGRRHPVPRLTCWVGDPGCSYAYSGLREEPHPWTAPLDALRDQLGSALGLRFNSLLLNRYRDGRDRMGWHADDEPELAADHPIASLSLGASRTLRFRPRPRPGRRLGEGEAAFGVELGDGDLLLMWPPTQRGWQHALPARLGVKGERLNLTFRRIRLADRE
jgi:alkylated DNA repair dioxygenase AlkB